MLKDTVFAGSIPQVYEAYLVPLIFQPFAADLAARVGARMPARVLELAAGTGVVTRAMASTLPPETSIIATDLNPAMLDHAASIGTARPVEWRCADALALPFPDASFDAVVCQFGVMFFPDKPRAFAEARRVLRPGGAFLFSVWDRIEENEFAGIVTDAVAALFPVDPPRFLARTPHGYFDVRAVEADLRAGGFGARVEVVTLPQRSRASSARVPAVGFCHGTPLRNEIAARDASKLGEVTPAAEAAIAARFGHGAVDGKMQAHVLCAEV